MTSPTTAGIPEHTYRGAAACIAIQEEALWEFLDVWREAQAAGKVLPETEDPDYASWAHLLWHVLACARGYLVWICGTLELPPPDVPDAPSVEVIEAEAEVFLRGVCAAWRTPLAGVVEKDFNRSRETSWGVVYCVDAMLEHAVLHPIRHTFQLRAL